MDIRIVKARRILRRWLPVAYETFKAPIFNWSSALALAVALLSTALLIQTEALPRVIDELSNWILWAQATAYVGLGWAAVCLVLAPFKVVGEDRRLGKWHGRLFVYHQPYPVAVIRVPPSRESEQFSFAMADAEIGSMVYCTVELQPPVQRVLPQVFGEVRMGVPQSPASWSYFRLPDNGVANVRFHTAGHTPGYTARIYCHQFEVLE